MSRASNDRKTMPGLHKIQPKVSDIISTSSSIAMNMKQVEKPCLYTWERITSRQAVLILDKDKLIKLATQTCVTSKMNWKGARKIQIWCVSDMKKKIPVCYHVQNSSKSWNWTAEKMNQIFHIKHLFTSMWNCRNSANPYNETKRRKHGMAFFIHYH